MLRGRKESVQHLFAIRPFESLGHQPRRLSGPVSVGRCSACLFGEFVVTISMEHCSDKRDNFSVGGESRHMRVDTNERHRPYAESPSVVSVADAALRFVQEQAGFAQVYTINRDGFPVGRTMVAVLNDDWTVDLVQRKVHRRLGQIRRNPRMEVVWTGPPRPDSQNDRPHVYDFGLEIPQVVFVRGFAQEMTDDEMVTTYERQTALQRSKGLTRAPLRSSEQAIEELAGVRVAPVQVRAEGFAVGAASFTWNIESKGAE